MTVWFKQGVIGRVTSQMLKARRKIHDWYRESFNQDLYITSQEEGTHSAGSLHYNGNAEDYRVPKLRSFHLADKGHLQVMLGPDFDVVLHSTHLHIEYDPK